MPTGDEVVPTADGATWSEASTPYEPINVSMSARAGPSLAPRAINETDTAANARPPSRNSSMTSPLDLDLDDPLDDQ